MTGFAVFTIVVLPLVVVGIAFGLARHARHAD